MTDGRTQALERAADWIFRDRTDGSLTVAQRPNLPLWLFAGLAGAAFATERFKPAARGLPVRTVSARLSGGAQIALTWWATDELLRGVNPWRKALGGATLLGLAARARRGGAGLS